MCFGIHQAALDDEEFGLDGGDDDAAPAASATVAKPAAAPPAAAAAKPIGTIPYQYPCSRTLIHFLSHILLHYAIS